MLLAINFVLWMFCSVTCSDICILYILAWNSSLNYCWFDHMTLYFIVRYNACIYVCILFMYVHYFVYMCSFFLNIWQKTIYFDHKEKLLQRTFPPFFFTFRFIPKQINCNQDTVYQVFILVGYLTMFFVAFFQIRKVDLK